MFSERDINNKGITINQTMLLSILATSFVVFTVVSAETCTTNVDCGSTACASGYHVICEHPGSSGITANGGLCTCAIDDLSCMSQMECQALNVTYYQCLSDGHKHCYDGKCICTRWRR